MENRRTTIERACELARSGKYLTVSDILRGLKAEKFSLAQIEGPVLKKQLKAICTGAFVAPDVGVT